MVVADDAVTIRLIIYGRDGEIAQVVLSPQRALAISAELLEAGRRRSGPDVSS